MEAPTTSAASAVTMIAPKRAVMIDHLSRAILNDQSSLDLTAHPSESARARPVAKRRTKLPSQDRAVRESGPLTCSTCQITYLPSAVPTLTVAPEDWDCDRCARVGVTSQQR